MQVNITENEYCKLDVVYEADPDIIKEVKDKVMSRFKNVKISGYRKGKAPNYAIKAKLKKQIDTSIVEELKSQAFDDAIFEAAIKPIGVPSFEYANLDKDKFACKMTICKKPEFDLVDYNYEIQRPELNVDRDKEINNVIENLRLRFGDVIPFNENDFVEMGDQVTLSYNATIDDEPFDGSTCEGQMYTVGEAKFPDFDDNLLGMKPDEVRDFDVTFPDNFPDLGGKIAHFSVTVHMGTKKTPHELNDDFAKKCGSENLDQLNDKLGKITDVRIKQLEKSKIRDVVLDRLINDHNFLVPEFLYNLEAQYIALQNGIDWKSLNDDEQQVFVEQGIKQVKLSLILDSIRDKEPDSVMSTAELQQSLANRLQLQGVDINKYFAEAQRSGKLQGVLSALKDEATVQWLLEQVKLV